MTDYDIAVCVVITVSALILFAVYGRKKTRKQ